MRWVPGYLPIEEFAFYIFGGLFVLGVYVWADGFWLKRYDTHDFELIARKQPKLLDIHWPAVFIIAGLAVLGYFIKRFGPHPEGFPGYYLFIVALGFAPTVLLLNGIQAFVNWRAFAFAYSALLLISLLWEATLGVPYGWWNYKHTQMLGVFIKPWGDLPVEAVLLWIVIAWVCIVVFELYRVVLHMDRGIRDAMLGARATTPRQKRARSRGRR